MSSPITISLEEEEVELAESTEYAKHVVPTQPTPQPRLRPGSGDWKNCLLELLKTAPPEEISKMFNREYLKEVLKEFAQNDPLLRLFFLLYG